MKLDLGIRCGHFLSMKGGKADPLRDIFIGIRGAKIAEISTWSAEKEKSAARFIDGRKFVAMPGLINTHTHLAMTLFRGLEDDVTFHRWLFKRILPLEAELVDREFVRIGTELAALESIRFGVTTVNDMYFYAEQIADVIEQRGLRAWVAQVWADAELPEDRVLGSDKAKLFTQLQEKLKGHERITATLGPHAPYTCSDETFKKVVRTADKFAAPIHTHLSETAFEVEESLKLHGQTPVKRLDNLGVLRERTLCAHCVHLSADDITLFKASGATMAHNPDSNMKLSSGVAPIARYRKEGILVGLGTDGAASNNNLSMFGAMDLATKLQKLSSGDNTAMVASDALACATFDGARALGLSEKTGSLEVGKDADLILVDLNFPHMQPVHDVRSHLVYSATGLEVDTVICRGRVLLDGKQHVGVDVERIYAEAESLREKVKEAADRLAAKDH